MMVYEKARVEVINLANNDIVTASGGNGGTRVCIGGVGIYICVNNNGRWLSNRMTDDFSVNGEEGMF